MTAIKRAPVLFGTAYPGSMFQRENGDYVEHDDNESLAGALLENIHRQSRELEEVVAEREQLKAVNAELAAELQNIANANPKNWDAPLNDTASFHAWAQSRARAALEKHKGETA